jgi:hypothetical protein
MTSCVRINRRFQSASADSPSPTSFSWWEQGQDHRRRQPASSRLLSSASTLARSLSEDMTRSSATAGSGNRSSNAADHPLKRVADGESAEAD